jgi:hypothetical protein
MSRDSINYHYGHSLVLSRFFASLPCYSLPDSHVIRSEDAFEAYEKNSESKESLLFLVFLDVRVYMKLVHIIFVFCLGFFFLFIV